jgi:predicted transposase YbfD/YdcC
MELPTSSTPPTGIPVSIRTHFASLEDPRVEGRCDHVFLELVTIALLAVICGATGWAGVETFARTRQPWLCTFLTLPGGAPTDATFQRVFARLAPGAFQRCFTAWMQRLADVTGGRVVAIDGKTLRRSFDRATGRAALHLVHAWVAENQILLGQVATDAKSNEITAIPALLDLLDLRGALVTIDAMGCQKPIAARIVDGGAAYLLSLKDNHPLVHAEVAAYFDRAIGTPTVHEAAATTDGDHGRIDVRRVWTTGDVAWFADRAAWKGLQTFVRVTRERTVGATTTCETVHYLSSAPADDPALLAAAIRAHWAVENGLHWTLDVTYHEDDSRIRAGHGAQNFALLRRTALSLLRNESSSRASVPQKQFAAALDPDYLLKVLAVGDRPLPSKKR